MRGPWQRIRHRAARRERERVRSLGEETGAAVLGLRVRLECKPEGERGRAMIEALGERYEIVSRGPDGLRFEVVVKDAAFPHEAVVRVASALDEIDREWEREIEWPKAVSR